MAAIHNIEGVELSSASSNSRYGTRDDSVVIKLQDKAKISCKFTSNAFQARAMLTQVMVNQESRMHLNAVKNFQSLQI